MKTPPRLGLAVALCFCIAILHISNEGKYLRSNLVDYYYEDEVAHHDTPAVQGSEQKSDRDMVSSPTQNEEQSFQGAEEISDPTSSRGRSIFYEWDDEDGINITSIISFLEYSTLPFVIRKIPSDTSSTSPFSVKCSDPILTTCPAYGHFKSGRLNPQFNLIADALNSKDRRDTKQWARLYDLLEENITIPILLDFSDTSKCYSEKKLTYKETQQIISRPALIFLYSQWRLRNLVKRAFPYQLTLQLVIPRIIPLHGMNT